MSNNASMALLAYIDAVHLDDALAWVEASDGCHRAWCERDKQRERRGFKGNNHCTLSSRCKLTKDETNTCTSQKITVCIFHILYTKSSWTTFLFLLYIYNFVSCFGSSGGVWERACEEGSCLSGVDEGLSEGCDSDHKRISRLTAIRRKCMAD